MTNRRRWAVGLGLAAAAIVLAASGLAQTPGHKVGGFASADLGRDQSWSWVANGTPPRYYHCHYHPFMEGVIRIEEGEPADVVVQIRDFAFTPREVAVGPGGNVTWTNLDESVHNVIESDPPVSSPPAGGRTPGPGLALLLGAAAVALRGRREAF